RAPGHDNDAVAADWTPRTPPAPAPAERNSGDLPLSGIRVLELGAWWSASACTLALGALGAEVIKLESPGMDNWRLTAAPAGSVQQWERSPMFINFNLDKQGMDLDIAKPAG